MLMSHWLKILLMLAMDVLFVILKGVVIDATLHTLMRHFNPTIAEALSIREALGWLKSLDSTHIIVKSNAPLVIEALNNLQSDISTLSLIVEICKIIARDFSSWCFGFVYRSTNQVGHTLAREAASMSSLIISITPHPTLLYYIVIPYLI